MRALICICVLYVMLSGMFCFAADPGVINVTAGESISFSDAVCYRISTKKWEKASTDHCGTNGAKIIPEAIALQDFATDEEGPVLISGLHEVVAEKLVTMYNKIYVNPTNSKLTTDEGPLDLLVGIAYGSTADVADAFQMYKLSPRWDYEELNRYFLPSPFIRSVGTWRPDQISWAGTPSMTTWYLPAPTEDSPGGTPAYFVSSNSVFIRYKTGATSGNWAGLKSLNNRCATFSTSAGRQGPRASFVFQITTGDTTKDRTMVALTDSDLKNVSPVTTPTATAKNFIGFFHENSVGANWYFCTGDGSNYSCDDTGRAYNGDWLFIIYKMSGGTDKRARGLMIKWQSDNDSTYLEKTSNVPDGADVCPFIGATATTNNAQDLSIHSVELRQGETFLIGAEQ